MVRKSRSIPSNPAIGIYCEGESEKQYFTMLSQKYGAKNVKSEKLQIKSLGKSGKSLIDAAYRQMKAKKQKRAYVVFDQDVENIRREDIEYMKECQALVKQKNNKRRHLEIMFSSVNFEVWILMHFEPVMKSYSKNDLYRRLSEKHFHLDYKSFKGESYRPYLFDLVGTAVKNADKLYKIHPNLEKDDPYTNIHKYLEEIFNECWPEIP